MLTTTAGAALIRGAGNKEPDMPQVMCLALRNFQYGSAENRQTIEADQTCLIDDAQVPYLARAGILAVHEDEQDFLRKNPGVARVSASMIAAAEERFAVAAAEARIAAAA